MGNRDDLDWLELRPKTPDAGFIKVEIGFSGKELIAMTLFDNFDRQTKLKFSNMKRNIYLASDIFIFIPPSGVDIFGK